MPPPSPIIASLASARRRFATPAPKLLALSLSAANYYLTQAAGGEKGINSPWCAFVMLDPRIPSAVLRRATAAWTGAYGWTLDLTASGALQVMMADGSGGTYKSAALPAFVASDFGRICCACISYDGANLRIERDRGAFAASTAMTAMVPQGVSIPQGIGNNGEGASGSATNFLGGWYFSFASFAGSPTLAQRQAYWDAARTAGDLPSTLGGGTLRHRHSVRDALAGQTVVDGQTAPATIADTATLATADAMARVGTPTVRVIDPAIDGRKSYGVLGFDGASYLQASGLALTGSASGIGLFGRVLVGGYASAEEFVIGAYGTSGTGWTLYTTPSGGGTLRIYVVGLGDIILGVIPPQSDVTWGFSWDGTQYIGYLNGAVTVGPTAGTTFLRNTDRAFRVGQNSGGGNPSTLSAPYLLAGCDSNLTAAEQLALHNSLRNTGVVSIPAGKTNPNVFDLTQDVVSNGGPDAGVPATIANRAGGSVTLSRVGTGLRVSRRTERLWSYDAAPIICGARNLSLANYLSVAGGLAVTSAAYWFVIALQIHAKAGGAFQAIMTKASANGQQGINLYGGSNFSSISFTHGPGAAPIAAPTYTVLDSDVGRTLLLGYQYTGAVLQAFAKRARNGGDVTATAFTPYAGSLMIGRHPDTTSNPGTDNYTVVGLMGGTGNIALAEYQAAHDAFVSEEDLIAVPGKTTRLWSVKRAQNGTLQPVPDAQGSGEILAITGAPTLSNIYTRAIAA